MQVSDVDLGTGRILATHFAEERQVLFAADWKANAGAGGTGLSDEIQQEGLEVLAALKTIAEELGTAEMRGIATEVFRKATNGSGFLQQIEQQLGIRASIIEQQQEARLGWLAAVAGSSVPQGSVVAWDSGGGSFQITGQVAADGGVQSYMGAWGSTVATDALVTSVRGKSFTLGGGGVNPVSMEEARALIDRIQASLEPAPAWLTTLLAEKQTRMVGIGGDTCIFRLASEVVGLLRSPLASSSQLELPREPDPEAPPQLTPEIVWAGIESTVGTSDAELSTKFLQHWMVVPKLCLCFAVMDQLSLSSVSYQPACGSCAGVLVDEWPAGGAM